MQEWVVYVASLIKYIYNTQKNQNTRNMTAHWIHQVKEYVEYTYITVCWVKQVSFPLETFAIIFILFYSGIAISSDLSACPLMFDIPFVALILENKWFYKNFSLFPG